MAVKDNLLDGTICLRNSMVKFKADYEELEILDVNKYRPGFLNR